MSKKDDAPRSFDPDALSLDPDDLNLVGDDLTLEGAEAGPDNAEPADIETMAAAELEEISATLKGFKQRAKQEEQRYLNATDSEYWFCLCFQTREQKDEFLKKVGWWDIGDKYLDGMLVAEAMGIHLDAVVPAMPQEKFDRRLSKLV